MSFLKNTLFLSKAERDYLLDINQDSHDYICVRSRLNKKLKVFVDHELPLLLEKGYLSDIAEFRNIADFRNAPNGLVAQLAERGFASNHQNENKNENKSPRWDLNPRPKVSAPPPWDERGITKPSLCQAELLGRSVPSSSLRSISCINLFPGNRSGFVNPALSHLLVYWLDWLFNHLTGIVEIGMTDRSQNLFSD